MRSRLAENPFFVLGVRPDASRAEIEREGQRLIAMIEVGLSGASHYVSPIGGMPRDADAVRAAMAELRDPDRRLVHELWAALAPDPERLVDGPPAGEQRPDGWIDAARALGWRS